MTRFVTNPTDFSAECARVNGQCLVTREKVIFLDDGEEVDAVALVQMQCGHVVITPDTSGEEHALLYHTSCQRMADVIDQIFQDALESPTSLPQHQSEMTVGQLHRRRVAMPYDACKVMVERFDF